MKLVVATKNQGKMREFKDLFEGTGFEIFGLDDLGISVDVEEDGKTFEENALKKAVEIMKICGEVTIADDSGICVEALGGAPGVYSSRYAGERATDMQNNLKLLKEMEGVKNRRAHFYCAMAIAYPDGRTRVFTGRLDGKIAHDMRGRGGFGYDVLFELPEYNNMTSAQISSCLKNKISHRARALAKLKEYLTAQK
jgi:XTP/dITP diphosphohydrolase